MTGRAEASAAWQTGKVTNISQPLNSVFCWGFGERADQSLRARRNPWTRRGSKFQSNMNQGLARTPGPSSCRRPALFCCGRVGGGACEWVF